MSLAVVYQNRFIVSPNDMRILLTGLYSEGVANSYVFDHVAITFLAIAITITTRRITRAKERPVIE